MKYLLTLLIAFSVALFAQPSMESLQQAEQLYLEGLQADKDNDRAKASAALQQAADIYSSMLANKEFDNAKLRYNLANVLLAQKRLGLAIHNYRRALELEPTNERIAANLDIARSLRKDQLTAAESDRVLKTLFAFHYDVSVQTREKVFAVCYIILFAVIIVRIFTKKRTVLTVTIVLMACVSAVLAASLTISRLDRGAGGVITASVVHAKVGSSNSYQDAFDAPLHDGTEFTLIESDSSGQWLHIRLENNSDGWIPANTALLDDAQ